MLRTSQTTCFFTTTELRDYHYQKQKNNAYYHIQAINLPFQNIEFYYMTLEQKKDEVKKKSITGKVTDSKKEPLPGVTILVKGTTIGVVTDVEGNYKITLPDQKEISLLFSFIGMVSQEIKVTNQTEINVVLEEDVENLEEVVVNGIFTRKASSFTGSIVSVTKEKLLQVSNQNVFQSLKNLDPSLMIFDNMDYGSDPNRNPKMQLQGTSSFKFEWWRGRSKRNVWDRP